MSCPAERVIPTNIESIEAAVIYGNAYHDMPIFDACHQLLTGTASLEEKCRALRKIDQTMGETEGNYTQADVDNYIEATKDF